LSARGFRIFKAKVGKDEDEDIARVMAISEGAPGCCFVLDANQGFQPAQAVEFIKNLLSRGIMIRAFEQPVNATDLDGMRFVSENANVPVIADEAAQTLADVKEIARSKAATGVNVKLMKCGMVGALEIISICKKTGLDLMFGCMLESKIAQSAAAHIACGTGAFSLFDLDSDLLLAHQPINGGAQRVGATLNVSNRPGLGCEIIESELEAFLEA
jgi:L-alanine-DL-glutamate epimerase-like enolase superfamily enzyme